MVDTVSHVGRGCTAKPGYGWPVRPFHRPHAIRGSFGDPRIGLAPSGVGLTYTFHTGVDVVAADGTPVYATLTGDVLLDPKNPDVVWVSDGHGRTFSYWHVVPSVRSGDSAVAYQTVIGHVQHPWGHVHFAELREPRVRQSASPRSHGALHRPHATERDGRDASSTMDGPCRATQRMARSTSSRRSATRPPTRSPRPGRISR